MGWLADILKEFPAVSVAKERLALVEQKYSDLEKKYDDMCKEIEKLKDENSELKAKLQELEAPEEVTPELKKLLVYLFNCTNQSQTCLNIIAQGLGVNSQMAQYYMDKLSEQGLARITGGDLGYGASYGLTNKGRAYVVEKGLLEKH